MHQLLCKLGIHCWEHVIDNESTKYKRVQGTYYHALFNWVTLPTCKRCRVCHKKVSEEKS